MDPEDYGPLVKQVRDEWSAAIKAAGATDPPEAEIARLRPWLANLFDLINARIPVVRYRKYLRALEMSRGFKDRGVPKLQDDDGMPEILNAVWLYRLRAAEINPWEFNEVGNRALEMCQEIARR